MLHFVKPVRPCRSTAKAKKTIPGHGPVNIQEEKSINITAAQAKKIRERGIEVNPTTLAKYLNEFRRALERKKDTPPPSKKTMPTPQPDRPATVSERGFAVTPDTPS